jgi:hypothetical protein
VIAGRDQMEKFTMPITSPALFELEPSVDHPPRLQDHTLVKGW